MFEGQEEVLKRAIKGERAAQEKLYVKNYNYAISIAMRYGGSRLEAQEVVNDAFINMFKRLDSFDLEREFKPWFRRIVVNASIDYYRKYHKSTALDDALEIMENDSAIEAEVLDDLSNEDIMKAVQALPPSYRMAFSMHVVDGFKLEEIAESLDISVGSVKSNLFKAKAKLKDLLNHWNYNNES